MKNPTSRLANGHLVDFLGVGAQKSGTTALFHYLRQHPSLVISKKKEGHFFDKEVNYPKGEPQYEKYHQYFGNVETDQLAGEVTPGYMFFPYCAQRIWNYNPNMRLIFILRNPVERVYSQWNMWRRNCADVSFTDMIVTQTKLLSTPRNELIKETQQRWFLRRSIYSEQIQGMLAFFPLKQMLFLKTENLRYDLNKTLEKVCDFLKVPPFDLIPKNELIFSYGHEYESIKKIDRELLIKLFKPSVHELEEIVDWDCSNWLR
jgi:hypothetical protein